MITQDYYTLADLCPVLYLNNVGHPMLRYSVRLSGMDADPDSRSDLPSRTRMLIAESRALRASIQELIADSQQIRASSQKLIEASRQALRHSHNTLFWLS